MKNYFSADAYTVLSKKQLVLGHKMDEAFNRGDNTEYIYLESKYRSITMALANIKQA